MTKKGGKSRSRSQRGGGAQQYPASAWGNVLSTAGSGWTQFMNTLSTNNPSQSNVLVPNTNANVNAKTMTGGRRRKGRKTRRTRSKRGGNIGSVLSQAAVPFTLVALNQFAKRRSKK